MLSKQETQSVLEKFFKDCNNYWLRSGYCKDEREAFENALDDIKVLRRDPFSPSGEELNQETKAEFIKYRKLDLGI